MYHNGYQNYLENEILTSNPLRLVQLLYQGALDAIESARGFVRAGDIGARSKAISKGLAILHELTASLDHSKGGEISGRLAALYDYIERLLIAANIQQAEAPLVEAQQLLGTLLEAWQASGGAEPPSAQNETEPRQALTYAG